MNINKRAGTLYESMFTTEALLRGLDVSETVGDYSQYDTIIDNGSKLFRVQVKGTQHRQKGRRLCFGINVSMGSGKQRKYIPNAFDVLAGLVISGGDKFWYIIPMEDIGASVTLKFYLSPTSSGKWEKYRHGWDLLCS